MHDVYPYYTYGHGYYTDQASSHILLEKNLAFRTEAAGCYQHFGRNVTFSNNIFALANRGELWHANFQFGQFGPSDVTFKRNIAFTSSPLFEASTITLTQTSTHTLSPNRVRLEPSL